MHFLLLLIIFNNLSKCYVILYDTFQLNRNSEETRHGYNITAGSIGIITSINLNISKTFLNLEFDIITKNLIGEVVEKLLTILAENMKLIPVIAIE